jgi:hypothetical protein
MTLVSGVAWCLAAMALIAIELFSGGIKNNDWIWMIGCLGATAIVATIVWFSVKGIKHSWHLIWLVPFLLVVGFISSMVIIQVLKDAGVFSLPRG